MPPAAPPRVPGIIVVNAQTVPTVVTSDASVTSEGVVTLIRRVNAHVVELLNLADFPWDSHTINIVLTAFAYDATEVLLLPNEAAKAYDTSHLVSSSFDINNWKIQGVVRPSLLTGRDSQIVASFVAARKSVVEVCNMVIPLVRVLAAGSLPIRPHPPTPFLRPSSPSSR